MGSTPQNIQQSTPSTTSTTVQPVVPAEEQSKTLLYVAIGILLLLIIGVGGYAVYDRYFVSEEDQTVTLGGADFASSEQSDTTIEEEAEDEDEDERESEADEDVLICTNEAERFSIQYPEGVEFDENCDYRSFAYSDVENIEVVDVITDFRKNWLFAVSRTETDLAALEFAQEEIGVLAEGGGVAEEGILPGSYQFVNDISHYSSISTYYRFGGYMYIIEINARNPDVSPSGDIQQLYNSIVATFKSLD